MAKTINLFTSNLEGKALRIEKRETKKAVSAALSDYAKSIDAEFTKVIKSEDRRARNVANAAKGKYQTALNVVANCYPYQTEAGVLCTRKKNENDVMIWAERKLTAAGARAVVRESLKNFTNYVGAPVITRVVVGAQVEK